MTYRITTCEGVQANLSAANTTVMLCRANIGRMAINDEERADLIWRIERQIAELEGMALELKLNMPRRRSSEKAKSQNVVDFRAR